MKTGVEPDNQKSKMKTVRNLMVTSFFLVTLAVNASPQLGVNVLMVSHEIFYFKVDKGWIGGEVNVLNAEGQTISVQKLDKKKITVDFFDFAPGTYKIVIKMGDCGCQEEFTYIKK